MTQQQAVDEAFRVLTETKRFGREVQLGAPMSMETEICLRLQLEIDHARALLRPFTRALPA